jgi:hypothetical protein
VVVIVELTALYLEGLIGTEFAMNNRVSGWQPMAAS